MGEDVNTAVFGSSSAATRASDTQKLLTYGYRFYENHTFEKADTPLATPRIWKGEARTLAVGVADDLTLTTPKGLRKPDTRMQINEPLVAPMAAGTVVGRIEVVEGEQVLAKRPLVTLYAVEEGGWWRRWVDALRLLFAGWFDCVEHMETPR